VAREGQQHNPIYAPGADRPPPGPDADLSAVEHWLCGQPQESGYIFDGQGRQVWAKHTTGLEVQVPPGAYRLLRGATFTHNHPSGWSVAADDPRRGGSAFSPSDVQLAARHGLAELRAVSPSYLHVLQAGPEGWPAPDSVPLVFGVTYDAIEARQRDEALRGILDEDAYARAFADLLHLTWVEIARLLGLRYRREVLEPL
jgi:hypothetical protein